MKKKFIWLKRSTIWSGEKYHIRLVRRSYLSFLSLSQFHHVSVPDLLFLVFHLEKWTCCALGFHLKIGEKNSLVL